MPDELVTRREFDALAQRVERIDAQGTRSGVALAEQMAGLAREIGRLEKALETHEATHRADAAKQAQAEQDAAGRRRSDRRFLVTTLISAAAAIDVPTLILVLHR